jgi:hypothetical protein
MVTIPLLSVLIPYVESADYYLEEKRVSAGLESEMLAYL